jgi:hypothetical protein
VVGTTEVLSSDEEMSKMGKRRDDGHDRSFWYARSSPRQGTVQVTATDERTGAVEGMHGYEQRRHVISIDVK